ncbi:MAG: DUF615 domain-containing protein [Desulfurivibrio sp.]|nr:DUF615 domain-containing protein [Desulfurivibrio sp.]
MQIKISRSAKKRQAARIEELARELTELTSGEIAALPTDDALKAEIRATAPLKTGSRKRQIKFIAGELRRREETEVTALTTFLADRKGSRLRQQERFHALENRRQAIINEALAAHRQAQEQEEAPPADWPSPSLEAALAALPDLDPAALRQAAGRYARSHKPVYQREVFRLLQSAQQRLDWQSAPATSPEAPDQDRE